MITAQEARQLADDFNAILTAAKKKCKMIYLRILWKLLKNWQAKGKHITTLKTLYFQAL
jgi:hypothetical protein